MTLHYFLIYKIKDVLLLRDGKAYNPVPIMVIVLNHLKTLCFPDLHHHLYQHPISLYSYKFSITVWTEKATTYPVWCQWSVRLKWWLSSEFSEYQRSSYPTINLFSQPAASKQSRWSKCCISAREHADVRAISILGNLNSQNCLWT